MTTQPTTPQAEEWREEFKQEFSSCIDDWVEGDPMPDMISFIEDVLQKQAEEYEKCMKEENEEYEEKLKRTISKDEDGFYSMGELSVIDYDQHMAMREEYEKKLKEKAAEILSLKEFIKQL